MWFVDSVIKKYIERQMDNRPLYDFLQPHFPLFVSFFL